MFKIINMNQYAGDSFNNSISKTIQSEDRISNGRRSKHECFMQALNFLNKKTNPEKNLKNNKYFTLIPSQSQIPIPKPSIIQFEPQLTTEYETSDFSKSLIHCSREEEFVSSFTLPYIG